MKKIIIGVVLLSTTTFAADYIVRLKDTPAAKTGYLNILKSNGKVEVLVEDLGIYKVTIDNKSLAQQIFSNENVKYSQEDHKVKMREVVPNDPQFAQLWSLKNPNGADIKATEAWTLGTKGTNLYGHDIVVAVVDGGVDITHNDLKQNLWVNKGEIAGNGVDDDGNGYVDDINGWNAIAGNGTLSADYHATHVAGIVAARGDNSLQVVGVNWNAKIMSINGASGNTSTVLKAYGYALKQKKIWLESQGQRGANVVVTNSSFGVDKADCKSGTFPAWNDIYNEMGNAGILSAAATANAGWDIDVTGDVPTGCESDFLITVTNTTNTDNRNGSAGWGTRTIDLGAPGTNIVSTYPNQQTRALTGTSMSTPHVAGAVAFVHSVASPQLQEMMILSPAQGALEVKKILLTTVDQVADLRGKTVSNGRLNLKKAGEKAYSYTK